MPDDQQRVRQRRGLCETVAQAFRIELGKAFVEHNQIGILEQRSCDEHAAAFAVRQLPPGLTHELKQPARHSVEQVTQSEPAAHVFCELEIPGSGRPAAA